MRRGGRTDNVTGTSTQERHPLVRERVPRRLRVIHVSGLGETIQEEPTSGLEPLTCSSRVVIQVLRGIARGCVSPIPRPVTFRRFAPCCTVFRSKWYQSGTRNPCGHCTLGFCVTSSGWRTCFACLRDLRDVGSACSCDLRPRCGPPLLRGPKCAAILHRQAHDPSRSAAHNVRVPLEGGEAASVPIH